MTIDKEIESIFNQIKADFKAEFGEDISINEIKDIADSEFKIIPYAMLNHKTVKLDYIGKFACKTHKQ